MNYSKGPAVIGSGSIGVLREPSRTFSTGSSSSYPERVNADIIPTFLQTYQRRRCRIASIHLWF